VPEVLALRTGDAVALTFDDAFANFASDALPLLREHGLPATLFVVTQHAGRDNRWRGTGDAGVPVLPLLNWDGIARAREAGVTIAAHTRTHPHLPALAPAEVEDELQGCAAEIERRTGATPDGFAYPYGEFDERIASIAGRHYAWACTTEFRPLASAERNVALPRLDAWYFRDAGRLEQWGTPAFRTWLWYRRQGRRARSVMRRMGVA
jgi:peptidoglycan/xylan/chitin deacetylase (PgdA/CDA1 family)